MSDIEYLQTLRRDLDSVSAKTTARSKRRTLRLWTPIGIAAVAAVLAGIVWSDQGHRSHGSPASARPQSVLGPAPVPLGTNPFSSGGQEVSLARARSVAGFAVPTPDSKLANQGNLSNVWIGSSTNDDGTISHEVVLDYVATNVRIYVDLPGPGLAADPQAAYVREAASAGVPASAVQTVNGAPALVIGTSKSQPGSLDTIRGGVHIAITGPYSAADLILIANSLPS